MTRRAASLAVALALVGSGLLITPELAGAVDPNRAPNCQARIDLYVAGDHSSISPETFAARVAWMEEQCDRNNAADAIAEDQGVLAPELFPPGEFDRHGTPLACMALDDARWGKHDNDWNSNPLLDPDFPGGMAPLNVPGDFMIAVIDGTAHFMVRNVVWAIEDTNGNIVNPMLLKQETWYNQLGNHTHASIWFEEAYVPTSVWVEIMDEADLAYGYAGSLLPGRVTLSRTWFAKSGCHDKRGPTVIPQIMIDHAKSLGWLQVSAPTANSHYLTMQHTGDPTVAANWFVSDVEVTPPANVQWTLGHPWFFGDDAGIAISKVPPTATITSPDPASVVRGETVVQVEASDFTDATGSLDVEVAVGAAWSDAAWNPATEHYEFAWDTTLGPDGPHTVSARATDSDENSGEAAPVSVRVANLGPTLRITNPAADGEISGSTLIEIDASDTTDSDGSLDVEISIDNESTWHDAAWDQASGRYRRQWATTEGRDGQHTITARATDSDGNVTTTIAISVHVGNDPPTLRLVAPVPDSLVAGTVTVAIGATDGVDQAGTLRVEASTDGGLSWTPATWAVALGRYELEWATPLEHDGPITMDIRAVDSDQNRVAASHSFTVVNRRSYGEVVLGHDPVAYWRLDESQGATAHDATAQGHDAIYRGAPAFGAAGLLADENTAVIFDGDNDRVRVPDADDINTGKRIRTYTVEMWFTAGDIDRRQMLFEQGGANRGISVYLQNGKLHAGAWNLTAQRPENVWGPVFLSARISEGAAHHAVFVFDTAAGQAVLYIDGDEAASATEIGILRRHRGNIGIGAVAGSTRIKKGPLETRRYFSGTLDEVALYATALDATTIASHYWIGVTGPLD